MPAIYPSTALKNQQREIKARANEEIVYITENGWGKYVFMSEDVLEQTVNHAIEQALYEKRLTDALECSRKDFEEGKYYSSREELIKAVADKRKANNA
jgi:PHD/YefM family antitoxin component YafN of YafNO toxin-antitoxin module